jgi:2-keto-4-pentenoate hydratase
MGEEDRQQAAAALEAALDSGLPVPPLTSSYSLTAEDAYAVQLINVQRRLAAGARLIGHKIGLTSEAMQTMLGVAEPDYGHLFADTIHPSGGQLSMGLFLQPRVEIEIAFVLRDRLTGPGVTAADVLRCTDYVSPSLEVVDSRIADWKITLVDTVADNASCGAVVLGADRRSVTDLDLAAVEGSLWCNGELREVGLGGAVLGNPAIAVAWLANKLAEFGTTLEPGHLVMPGSCTRMIPVAAGDHVRAEFAGLGHVEIEFTD